MPSSALIRCAGLLSVSLLDFGLLVLDLVLVSGSPVKSNRVKKLITISRISCTFDTTGNVTI